MQRGNRICILVVLLGVALAWQSVALSLHSSSELEFSLGQSFLFDTSYGSVDTSSLLTITTPSSEIVYNASFPERFTFFEPGTYLFTLRSLNNSEYVTLDQLTVRVRSPPPGNIAIHNTNILTGQALHLFLWNSSLLSYNSYQLLVNSPTHTYGLPIQEHITFFPPISGNYTITLRSEIHAIDSNSTSDNSNNDDSNNENSNIENVSNERIVGFFTVSEINQRDFITIAQTKYIKGQTVQFEKLAGQNKYSNEYTNETLRLQITSGSSRYHLALEAEQNEVIFRPPHEGIYLVDVFLEDKHIQQLTFSVSATAFDPSTLIDRTTYVIGETVYFNVPDEVRYLAITYNDKIFTLTGSQLLPFLPQRTGNYSVSLTLSNGEILTNFLQFRVQEEQLSALKQSEELTFTFDLQNTTEPFRSLLDRIFGLSPISHHSAWVQNSSADAFTLTTQTIDRDIYQISLKPLNDSLCGKFTVVLEAVITDDTIIQAKHPFQIGCRASQGQNRPPPRTSNGRNSSPPFSFNSTGSFILDLAPYFPESEILYADSTGQDFLLDVASNIDLNNSHSYYTNLDTNRTMFTISTTLVEFASINVSIASLDPQLSGCFPLQIAARTQQSLRILEKSFCVNTLSEATHTYSSTIPGHVVLLPEDRSSTINLHSNVTPGIVNITSNRTILKARLYGPQFITEFEQPKRNFQIQDLPTGKYRLELLFFDHQRFGSNQHSFTIAESILNNTQTKVQSDLQQDSSERFTLSVSDYTGTVRSLHIPIVAKRHATDQGIIRSNNIEELTLSGQFDGRSFDTITLSGFRSQKSPLRVDEQVPTTAFPDNSRQVTTIFGLDPTGLEFAQGHLSRVAQNSELWKCAEWDFDEQQCLGTWMKIRDLTPGEQYDIFFTPDDPAFAEVGLASINTNKDRYLPGEEATLTMIVLDQEGNLVSGAHVDVFVQSPSQVQFSFSTADNSITEIEKGVYETRFAYTNDLGLYTMSVQAVKGTINSTLFSTFRVEEDFPFEIQRNTPHVTDPFVRPFSTFLRVVSRGPQDSFNLTEYLPLNFTVERTDGAEVFLFSNHIELRWYNLTNGSEVFYVARSPKISPELYELGPAQIHYSGGVFSEARRWNLAIDPAFFGTFFLLWDGATNEPAGWTCVSCNASGDFFSRFIRGAATYGGTGGFVSHEHTASFAVADPSTIAARPSGAGTASSTATHGHAASFSDPGTIEHLPPFRQLKVIAYSGGIPSTVPQGALGLFNTSSLPGDWTLYSAQNALFVLANATQNITGGSASHTHDVSVALGAIDEQQSTTAGTPVLGVASGSHSHTAAAGTSGTASNLPRYRDVVIARATVDTTIPYSLGFIAMFNDTPPDGWTNMSQSGDDFNDRFIRGAASYGGTGGANNHTHSNLGVTSGASSGTVNTRDGGPTDNHGAAGHTHDITITFDSEDSIPPFINVIFAHATTDFTGIDSAPSISLVSPNASYVSRSRSVQLVCSALDDIDISTVVLYTNLTGSFVPNQTLTASGASNTSVVATFTLANLLNQTSFHWSCSATDNNSQTTFASENRTVFINDTPAPVVTLVSPGNAAVVTSTSIDFTCSAVDNFDIASLNLYTNRVGSFSFEQTRSFPGTSNTAVSHTFTVSGFSHGETYLWNCNAVDNDSQTRFSSQNYTFTVNLGPPNATLYSPSENNVSTTQGISLTCGGVDNEDLVNISLYHNIGGTFSRNQTATIGGTSDTAANITFNLTGVPYGTRFEWNCLVTDNNSQSAFAENNRTLVLPTLEHHYADVANGDWTTPNNARGAPDGTTANQQLDDGLIISVSSFTTAPTVGTLLASFLSLAWRADSSAGNDDLDLGYSLSAFDSTNFNLDGSTYSGATEASNFPTGNLANQSYQITGPVVASDLDSMRLRIQGVQVTNPDNNAAYIDSLYLSILFDYYPSYTSVQKSSVAVFQYDVIHFYSNWTDDLFLDCYIFSINQTGTWVNSSCISFSAGSAEATANYTLNITANAGTIVEWMFFANDSSGQMNSTPKQTFTVADPNDLVEPTISNEQVQPSIAQTGTQFNISATITDNFGVTQAFAQVTSPSGSVTNYSMSQNGNLFTYLYTSTIGGRHSVSIIALDGVNNVNTSASQPTFNVTSKVSSNAFYYERGNPVVIKGSGFNASSSAELSITSSDGSDVSGFPLIVATNSTGGFSYTWNIPSSLANQLDGYSILANDSSEVYLYNSTPVVTIGRSDTSTKFDDNFPGGTGVKTILNQSDDVKSTLVGSTSAVRFDLRFQNQILEGYQLESLSLNVEHQDFDAQSDPLVVQYYDGAAYQTATCANIPFSSTETVGICNLTSNLGDLPDFNDIRLRLTDNNLGADGSDFTQVDFVFINFTFNITNNLAVTIDVPANDIQTLDYSESVFNTAYEGQDGTDPPPSVSQLLGTEALSADYTTLATSNNQRWQSGTVTNNQFVYHSFFFRTSDTPEDLVGLTVEWEGYIVNDGSIPVDVRIFGWNWNTGAYVDLNGGAISGSSVDQEIELTFPGTGIDFVNSTGHINVLVVSNAKKTGGDTRQDIYTDYVKVDLATAPVLSGFQDINITAVDADGVTECTIYFVNSTGLLPSPLFAEQISSTQWYNQTDTSQFPDGLYNLTANCTDGSEVVQDVLLVRIINVPPSLELLYPPEGTSFTSPNISFSWNATQLTGSPLCDLTIDGSVAQSNIVANNGFNTTVVETGVSDGAHSWSITCEDQAGLENVSETRNFTVDTGGPSVALNSPSQNAVLSSGAITFLYTPTDTGTLNCSLYLDGTLNQTNSSVPANQQAGFSITSVSEGLHSWYVNCTDSFSFSGNSTTRSFTVDLTDPTVSLHEPSPAEIILGGFITFNYTAYDNLDTILTCDIVVNSVAEFSNVASANGTAVTRSTTLNSGLKYWNVSCTDNSGRTNTSTTRNFTIQGPPTVTLTSPANASTLNQSNVTLYFFSEDTDGLENCSLYLNGVFNQTNFFPPFEDASTNNFSIIGAAEGNYNWSVTCFDVTGDSTTDGPDLFTLDRTPPNITLLQPADSSFFETGDITFNFTVVDNLDTTLTCSLLIDGLPRTAGNQDFSASNGSITQRSETGILGGLHDWQVFCNDNTGIDIYSETLEFTVGGAPQVYAVSPDNNAVVTGDFALTYFVNDTDGIENCSVYINNTLYDTNFTPNNGAQNSFSFVGFSEQTLNWSVACYDTNAIVNQTTNRFLTIDNTPPTVVAISPNETTESSTTVEFNFTVTDNVATSFICNITVNGTLEDPNFAASSGFNTRTIGGLNEGGNFWNVSCADTANLSSSSNTLNFTIFVAPDVLLLDPPNEGADTDGDVSFAFRVNNNNIENCTLFINEIANATINSTQINPFTTSWINYSTTDSQILNWTVGCLNTGSVTANATNGPRELHIDFVPPNVTLHSPIPFANYSVSTITFNFTAYDDLDPVLVCNLTIDEQVNVTNINATNGTVTERTVTGLDVGNHTWSVSCTDGGFVNSSGTRNFTISAIPTIQLVSPENSTGDGDGIINFTYIPSTINESGFSVCSLFIDGSLVDAVAPNPEDNGVLNTFPRSGILEGNHDWYVNCTDAAGSLAVSTIREFYVDLTNPSVTAHYPNQTTVNSSFIFNFTALDNFASSLSCSILNNGTLISGISAPNNSVTNQSVGSLSDGLYYWNATCTDDVLRSGTSVTLNYTVAEKPTVGLISLSNGYRTDNTTVRLSYLPKDNSGLFNNCTLIFDGAINQTNNSIINGSLNNFTVSGLEHGTYNWTVNCTDAFGNHGINNTPFNFSVDLQGPAIQLIYPGDDVTFNLATFNFTWTPVDHDSSVNVSCNITVTDSPANRFNSTSALSGIAQNYTFTNLTEGEHFWNVTCADDFGNSNTSETFRFVINQPDFVTNSSLLVFNSTNPDHNETINITLTVSNIGGLPGNNVLIEFYDNDPQVDGVFIGNYTTNIAVNATIIASVLWNITPGYHTVHALVDPNNAIGELNETNNNATNNISVLFAQINSPATGLAFASLTVDFNFTVGDYLGPLIDYIVFIDGFANVTGSAPDNQSFVLGMNFSEGVHTVYIQSNSTRADIQGQGLRRIKNSTFLQITTDVTAPAPVFVTANETWFATPTPQVFFSITDAVDTLINYTLFVDGSPANSSTINSGSTGNVTLSSLSDGPYVLVLEGLDDAGNRQNSTPITIYVDTTVPSSVINTANHSNFSTSTPSINFTLTDNLASTINYTFYVSASADASGNASNGTATIDNLTAQADGRYVIVVEAIDQAGNRFNSSGINITIDTTAPFITIDNPQENEVLGHLIDLLNTISDNLVGIDTVRYEVINDSNLVILDSGFLTAGAGFDTQWNSSEDISTAYDTNYVNFTIYANDTLGNLRTSSVRFVVDNRRPSIDILYPFQIDVNSDFVLNISVENDHLNSSSYNITDVTGASLKQNNSNTSIFIASFEWHDYVNISNVTKYPEGVYNISVYALDHVGNDRTTQGWFRIDRTSPVVTLNAPLEGFNFSTSSLTFNYTVTDNLASTLYCNLTVNGSVVNTTSIANNTNASILINSLAQGQHFWNVTCDDPAGNRNSSETRSFVIDTSAPIIGLGDPINETIQANSTVVFYYTPHEAYTGLDSCTLVLDGTLNETDASPLNNVENNFTVTGIVEGLHDWTVNCTDILGFTGTNSSHKVFTIDLTPPTPTITTTNLTFFSTSTPTIDFVITDNIALSINYTFYVDGILNVNGTISNNTPSSAMLSTLGDGYHTIVLEGIDQAGNRQNSSPITIVVDTVSPNVTGLFPQNDTELFFVNINFTWLATDALSSTLLCNLTINDVLNTSGFVTFNATATNLTRRLNTGIYSWYVNCSDNASNVGSTGTLLFNITPPDLTISNQDIFTNKSGIIKENDNITLFANISNIGSGLAENIDVVFYEGIPGQGGIQIGTTQSISSLTSGQVATVNVSWIATIGSNLIFVSVDPLNSIIETNELNNNASTHINVSSWSIFVGNQSGNRGLQTALNTTVFLWNGSNSTGNVYVADSDSQISWSSLQSLGRTTSDVSAFEDFAELDAALNMSDYPDSVNKTYTFAGSPRTIDSLQIFSNYLNNVPFANSTNSTTFTTGILWDYSTSGSGNYNGSEDVVFVSTIHLNTQGAYGVYDFEIRAPAPLRALIPTNSESVTLYLELS